MRFRTLPFHLKSAVSDFGRYLPFTSTIFRSRILSSVTSAIVRFRTASPCDRRRYRPTLNTSFPFGTLDLNFFFWRLKFHVWRPFHDFMSPNADLAKRLSSETYNIPWLSYLPKPLAFEVPYNSLQNTK